VAGDGWLHGAPELVVEVAATTAAYDLYEKKLAYEAAGVQEYIAVLVLDQVVRWFVLRDGRYGDLEPGADGILRSEVFPGLWLDPNAMLQSDIAGVLSSLRDGLASPEHAEFVARVQAPSG
jgi:Uma2 family endonuclease